MIPVTYPSTQFKIKNRGEQPSLFCLIRKQWMLLTEEEWVRQNFVAYLVSVLKYPSALIALEKEMKLNGLKKRFDIMVYDHHHKPWMMIECKAPGVSLTEETLQQVLRYNISIPVPFIIITNGSYTIGWKKESSGLEEIFELPSWNS